MNRKEFLIQLWKKAFKPFLFLVMIYFCFKFLFAAISDNGIERFTSIFLLSIIILFLLIYLIGIFLKKTLTEFYNRLSNTVKLYIRVIRKVSDYFLPFILGALLVDFWEKDWLVAFLIFGAFFIEKIYVIIKDEQKIKNNES